MVLEVAFEQNETSCSGSHEGQKKNGDEWLYPRATRLGMAQPVPGALRERSRMHCIKRRQVCLNFANLNTQMDGDLLAEFQFDSDHHDAHIFICKQKLKIVVRSSNR